MTFNLKVQSLFFYGFKTFVKVQLINPIRSGGGGGFKSPPHLRIFALTHLILELHYCALVTFPKK